MPLSYEIFATRRDILAVLESVEEVRAVQYVQTGLFESDSPTPIKSARDIEDLGVARVGDQNFVPAFLVLGIDQKLIVRAVPQRKGGIRFAIDQLKNPKSVVVSAGGNYRGEALISGHISTVSNDEDSLVLLRFFGKEIRRRFERIQAYWVGKDAARALDSGLRLTANITAPREADLQRMRK